MKKNLKNLFFIAICLVLLSGMFVLQGCSSSNNTQGNVESVEQSKDSTPEVNDSKTVENLEDTEKTNPDEILETDTKERISKELAVYKNNIYFTSKSGKIICCSLESFEQKWAYDAKMFIYSQPFVTDDKVLFNNQYTIYCLNAENGKLIWEYKTKEKVMNAQYLIKNVQFNQNTILVSFESFGLYCLNPENGEKLWEYKTDQEIKEGFFESNNLVYFMSNHFLYCLNAENGKLIWKHKINDMGEYLPIVSNGKIYFELGVKLYCLDAKNGRNIWDYKIEFGTGFNSQPVIYNEKFYFVSFGPENRGGNWYCIDSNNGKRIWQFGNHNQFESTPALLNDKIYISNYEKLYCLDNRNGKIIWEYNKGFASFRLPIVTENELYFGSEFEYAENNTKGKVFCLDAQKGSKVWEFETENIYNNHFILTNNKLLFFSYNEDENPFMKLYCIDSNDGKLIWEY